MGVVSTPGPQFSTADPIRVTMVCTGNICRSPYAAVLLRQGLAWARPGAFEVTSAGTHALVGRPMDEGSVERLAAKGLAVAQADFLTIPPPPGGYVDVVLMNPPFAKRADVHHIRHAFQFLRPGGRLVAIASASVSFRSDHLGKDFRLMVEAYRGSITPLPDDSFRASGTSVNTCLVTMTRPAN